MYRNLDTLEELGLVRHVHLGHGPGRYALARPVSSSSSPASAAAAFETVPPGRLDAARALIERETGFRARFTHFPIVGTCASCVAAGEPTPRQEHHAMHIPDGFLSNEVALACAVPAVAAVGYGLRRASVDLDERRVPLLGVTAAFVFAAQMLNFPVAGGTSGHFLGAALAAILLGPWLACLVMAVVLVVQAFVFADGGVTALGREHPQHGRDRRRWSSAG